MQCVQAGDETQELTLKVRPGISTSPLALGPLLTLILTVARNNSQAKPNWQGAIRSVNALTA